MLEISGIHDHGRGLLGKLQGYLRRIRDPYEKEDPPFRQFPLDFG
jgi:hypothetical protein